MKNHAAWMMSGRIPRRRFLKGSTAAVAAAAIGPVVFFAGDEARASRRDFTKAHFDDLIGQHFVMGAHGGVSVQLVEVSERPGSPGLEQFDVKFEGPANLEAEEGTYDFYPPSGEQFALHVLPVRGGDAERYYRASFSLLLPLSRSCAA